MPANTFYVGVSNTKGFTPMGEHHLTPSSIDGKIPCQLTGKGIDRPTTLWVRPGRVRTQISKYRAEGQTLAPPKSYDLSAEPEADVPESTRYVPVPRPPRKTSARPVICLNTGKFFDSVAQVCKAYKLSSQLVNYHLSVKGKQAKGHTLRYAEPAEIMEADLDINWHYKGELIPMVSGKRTF